MRASAIITSLILFTTLGALAMSTATADAQEKKDEPKELKVGKVTFNEKVTIKVYADRGGTTGFLPAFPNVWAVRREVKKPDGTPALTFAIRTTSINDTPTKGTLITDKDGNEYEITEVQSELACYVKQTKKADPPKKP